jgi:ADP-heptose:LPS heptosyltransferase
MLGALGSVVRTMSVAKKLKEENKDSEIVWVTKENVMEIFDNFPYVDEVVQIGSDLSDRKFDVLYNFDMEYDASEVAKEITADYKFGFYVDEGYPVAFNPESEYYLNTVFDDELKKKNRKTYQQMMFDLAGLAWDQSHAEIVLTNDEIEKAHAFLNKIGRDNEKKLVGLHIGASKRWPSKRWDNDRIKEFIFEAEKKGLQVIIFAGPDEGKEQEKLKDQFPDVLANDPANSIRDFAALANACDIMVCGDSFALHVALSLRIKTIGLFFCTTPHEVEDYGLLTKIVSPMFEEFFPERQDEDNEDLRKSIEVEEVLGRVGEIL